ESHGLSQLAKLIADPGRAIMLTVLLDGRARTATELSLDAGITPQTASSHLKQLLSYHLLKVIKQGRHRYYQLAGPAVAELLETLLNFSQKSTPIKPLGTADVALRYARSCYDHLAGNIAVQLLSQLQYVGYINLETPEKMTAKGHQFFRSLGIDTKSLLLKKRPFIRPCLDWSERRYHIAGCLGQAIFEHGLSEQWFVREQHSRAIKITQHGKNQLMNYFNIDADNHNV
ncbi:MAG: transcriptional regulator, partial [Gammaproteobacteria bacterium]